MSNNAATVMVPIDGGLEFECLKNRQSVSTAQYILSGETYPVVPLDEDVEVVMDIGANCGSASVFFSSTYPQARILAFEPARVPYRVLTQNARRWNRIEPFNIGLSDRDDQVVLYEGEAGTGSSSVFRRPGTTNRTERISLRSARAWLEEHGVSRVDILKVDTEGCEMPILSDLRPVLPKVQVIYLEFHSEEDRRSIDELLGPTHDLAVARVLFGQGEMTYVSKSVANGSIDS